MTILGAERRLFFVALLSGAGIFNLVHSLAGGFALHRRTHRRAAGYQIRPRDSANTAELGQVQVRYDPMKWEPIRNKDQIEMFKFDEIVKRLERVRGAAGAYQPLRLLG